MIDRPTVAPLPSRAPACVGALFFVPLPARRRYLGAEPGPAGAIRTGTRERDPAGRSRDWSAGRGAQRHYNVLRRAGRARLRMQNVGTGGSEFIYDVRLKKGVSAEAVAQALAGIPGMGTVNAVAGSEEP